MYEVFGKKLKELRQENSLRQIDLSLIMGVSKTTICQWETSKQEPSLEDIVKLSKYFNVSADFLLDLEDEFGNKKHN